MHFAGIDVGSTTSKCVLVQDGEMIGSALVDMGIGTAGPERAYSEALAAAGAVPEDVACCVATGYGRSSWKGADQTISELTAHGLGNHFLFPDARTVIDIGGQDAKVIELDANGQIATRYVDLEGLLTMDTAFNPNGSMEAVEGVTSPDGRVLGKMGHSERVGPSLYKNVPGSYDLHLFEAARDFCATRLKKR